MAGTRGKSGGSNRLSVGLHQVRGTFKPSRHAAPPLAPGAVPAKVPTAPKHLRPETRRWFRHVVTTWALEQHHLRLLIAAGEAWDQGAAAGEQIRMEGMTVKSSRGAARLNPLLRLQESRVKLFQRLIAQLGEKPRAHEWRHQATAYLRQHVREAAAKKIEYRPTVLDAGVD